MKIRLGVIGPEDSIERIKNAASGFSELELILFPYKRTEETETIILENKHLVDQWFFSGQSPYYYAVSKGAIKEEEGSFAPLYGSSLFGTLLEAQVQENRILKRMSLDTIQMSEIESVQKSFSLDSITIHTYPYSGYLPAEDISNFHEKLFQEGKIDTAITCIQSVFASLKEKGIPCYRVTPSVLAIQLVLQYLKERGQSTWYRKAQIAILGVEVIYPTNSEEQLYSYKMKRNELELKRTILDYAEQVNGSFVQIADGHFYIYTTRGELDLQLNANSLFSLIDNSYVQSKLKIRMGLGYGLTALSAEQNVRLAFQYARQHESPVVVSVNEDKKVTKSFHREQSISFEQRKWGLKWEEKFKEANISSTMVSKIESLARHYGKELVTSQELSHWIRSTERNARRILFEMEQLGLAKISGEEQSGARGRPRKIYKLNLSETNRP
ncbi:hypothetical protein [Pseudalkalibacillus decolorationis]|uniref:hypothetical protein n=1 Tax=Pseudalkalibacillus decolorationis TaxID=163879 RepID=UPI0021492321|nr:hypothetical protein [Pseudalkalibacillus decolorationis]